jgi:hypothetical protein
MPKLSFSEADKVALRYGRFHHRDLWVRVRMEALYLSSQEMANGPLLKLYGISKASFQRYLNVYMAEGSSN